MATRETIELEINAKGDTTAIKRSSAELKKLEQSYEDVGLSAQQSSHMVRAWDKQVSKGLQAVTADAKQLDQVDPKVTVVADTGAATADVKALIDWADELASKDVQVKVKADTAAAKQGVDDLGKSADSSKSVLANMVGNTTQDLGALGGVAGSAGVAIGQMGEYMADALGAGESLGSTLRNFAKIALPVAGFAALVAVIQNMDNAAKRARERAEGLLEVQTLLGENKLREGFTKLADTYDELFDATERLGFSSRDVFQAINTGTGPVKQLADAYLDTKTQTAAVDEVQRRLNVSQDDARNILNRLTADVDRANAAWRENAGDSGEANRRAGELIDQFGLLEPATEDVASATKDAAAAQQEHAAALQAVNAAAQVQLDAFMTLPDAIDAQSAAFIAATEAAKEYNKEPTAENLAKVEEAAKSLAKADTDLAKATAEANNRQFDAADALSQTTVSLLKQAAVLQGPAKQAIMDRIAQLHNLPPTKMTEIQTALDTGDIAWAERIINQVSRTRDAAIRAEATNVGYTEQQLANLARNRRAQIHVSASPGGTGGLTGGGLAEGGPVQAGVPYTVGERHRETFVPAVDGHIVNHADTLRMERGGGAGTTVNVYVSGADPQAVVAALEQYVSRGGKSRVQRLVA